MQVLKIKYKTDNLDLIKDYMKQYSSCQHYVYNRIQEGLSQKQIKQNIKFLNNINLLDSWFIQCSFYDIPNKDKVIFGGKKNFFQRIKGKISKEEYKLKRLSSLYSIGEIVNKSVKANRKFHIEQDLTSIIFKPNKQTKLQLNLIGVGNRLNILKKLYLKQEQHQIKIAYKLDLEYIYICFEETDIVNIEYQVISNRVMSIDMNPNYIGWSIIDWKSESDFNIIKSDVISIKKLNDYDQSLKDKGLSSESKERKYISNKRNYETLQISKNLINKAIYYKCQIFSIEDLNIKSGDCNKGRKFNKLVNNNWCRNKLINNLVKRCNIFGIKLLQVKPEYSSFIGNFLFRTLNLPDPILASIEISRRGYEFYNQYITKVKEIKKNIIQPKIDQFRNLWIKSLEEFDLKDNWLDFKQLYLYFKKSKLKYRLSIDNNLQFSRVFSAKSQLSVYNYK